MRKRPENVPSPVTPVKAPPVPVTLQVPARPPRCVQVRGTRQEPWAGEPRASTHAAQGAGHRADDESLDRRFVATGRPTVRVGEEAAGERASTGRAGEGPAAAGPSPGAGKPSALRAGPRVQCD